MDPLIREPRFKTDEEKEKDFKWKRRLGLFLTFITGILMTIRVLIDGKVSFYGVLLGLISKIVVGANYAFDPSLQLEQKISYGIPKIFSTITSIITIIGIIINDSEFYMHI